jgi:hypothetical protein
MFEIRRRVQNILPWMRNTQMNFVVYGCSFGSIHLYFLHQWIDQKSQNNLKQNKIRTCLTIFHLQNRKSTFFPTVKKYMLVPNRGMSEWLLFKAKWAICQTRTSFSGTHDTDSLIISLYFYSFRYMFSGEAADTKLFCLKRSGIENMSYCTWIKQANH